MTPAETFSEWLRRMERENREARVKILLRMTAGHGPGCVCDTCKKLSLLRDATN